MGEYLTAWAASYCPLQVKAVSREKQEEEVKEENNSRHATRHQVLPLQWRHIDNVHFLTGRRRILCMIALDINLTFYLLPSWFSDANVETEQIQRAGVWDEEGAKLWASEGAERKAHGTSPAPQTGSPSEYCMNIIKYGCVFLVHRSIGRHTATPGSLCWRTSLVNMTWSSSEKPRPVHLKTW